MAETTKTKQTTGTIQQIVGVFNLDGECFRDQLHDALNCFVVEAGMQAAIGQVLVF